MVVAVGPVMLTINAPNLASWTRVQVCIESILSKRLRKFFNVPTPVAHVRNYIV
jgi:hypothetical protein